MVFSYGYGGGKKPRTTKNTPQTPAILIAMQMQRCNAGCIAQWSAYRASLKATVCCHRVSALITLPRGPPWWTILVKNIKH